MNPDPDNRVRNQTGEDQELYLSSPIQGDRNDIPLRQDQNFQEQPEK